MSFLLLCFFFCNLLLIAVRIKFDFNNCALFLIIVRSILASLFPFNQFFFSFYFYSILLFYLNSELFKLQCFLCTLESVIIVYRSLCDYIARTLVYQLDKGKKNDFLPYRRSKCCVYKNSSLKRSARDAREAGF